MTNKKVGNDFELEFCEMLSAHGVWVLNVPMSRAGQPADVIAVKNQHAFLIDCKVVSTTRGFALSRIEENQQMSMYLWKECGNGEGWFALKLPNNEIYMVSRWTMLGFSDTQSRLSLVDIYKYGIPFEEWVKKCLR